MISDRVGDFIIRLQNASAIGLRTVEVPHSNHLEAIARKLKDLGVIADVATRAAGERKEKKTLVVSLAYDAAGVPRIRGVKRLSKPGRRAYVPSSGAHRVAGGAGARIISTSKGIVADREARASHAGGEALFEIW